MNLVGKILVVLIFVMSTVYLGFAVTVYSTHHYWKDAADKFKKQRSELEVQRNTAETERDAAKKSIQDEVQRHEQALAKLENEKADLETQLKGLRDEKDKQEEALRKATAAATVAVANVEAADKKVEQLRADIQKVRDEKDEYFKQFVLRQDELNSAVADARRLAEMEKKLTEQLTSAKLVLDRNGLSVFTDVSAKAVKVDGLVTAVGKDGLMEISIGSDDGLQRGHTLEVTRGAKYMGRVLVIESRPEKAVAKSIPEFQKGKIEKDDRVATRIN